MRFAAFACVLMSCSVAFGGTCTVPPLFDMSGPACGDYISECRCSECFTWAPAVTTAGVPAEWYEVARINPDGSTVNVGDTRWRNHAAFSDDDGDHAASRPSGGVLRGTRTFPGRGRCTSIALGRAGLRSRRHAASGASRLGIRRPHTIVTLAVVRSPATKGTRSTGLDPLGGKAWRRWN
jgi:hypothetical protein